MAVNVKLGEGFVDLARRSALAQHRSLPKQIEYWSMIGRIAEENPDLPFTLIRGILQAQQEESIGEYKFGPPASE